METVHTHIGIGTLTRDESYLVALGMRTDGGSFARSLGAALALADLDNATRIKLAFPEYWNKYLERGRELHARDSLTQ